ncbi:hypothetical protein E2562_010526 [Oryza meyeriana var. granulata]|uniref:Helicase C-terminal domain-containing protein n=1 Tax=Oryza meyeriana var. granulata TaxID=110450 RepID=A0A6G1DVY2_9ORYZ|nr:hypothetical protein E2562_010526 [Oryza meyeriana var. granulata]
MAAAAVVTGGGDVSKVKSPPDHAATARLRTLVLAPTTELELHLIKYNRGIDVELVNIVINYDMPDSAELYLHRSRHEDLDGLQ